MGVQRWQMVDRISSCEMSQAKLGGWLMGGKWEWGSK